MKYLSVCSGIEAASVAWHPLGWTPLAFSEIEAFPRAVLAHHYPGVPLHGDFTVLRDQPWIVDADILVGGTPCQAFSVAGLRNSLSDERGNLSLEFVRLADAIDDVRRAAGKAPAVIVWENVPGVLSVRDNAFGSFLAGLAGEDEALVPSGKRWTNAGCVFGPQRTVAWRVLDAQYFGLAQRRRRVFVIASARDGFDPAAVLLEFEGVRRDTPPRREAREIAPTIPARSTAGGGLGTDFDLDVGVIRAFAGTVESDVAATIQTTWHDYSRADGFNMIAHSLRAEGFDASKTGRGTPLVPVVASTLKANNGGGGFGSDPSETFLPVAFAQNTRDEVRLQGGDGQIVGALAAEPGMKQQTYVAIPEPYTLAIRGRGDSHQLEYRQDGTANAILTPNGGRAGIGVGAVAVQSGETGKGDAAPCVAVSNKRMDPYLGGEVTIAIDASYAKGAGGTSVAERPVVEHNMAVRRLTPVECERLQGFPDNYTNIPWRKQPTAPDGPRYKALGNSMAVPCMRWIGARIQSQLKENP